MLTDRRLSQERIKMNKISISEAPKLVVQSPENEDIDDERYSHELKFNGRIENFRMILMNHSQQPIKHIFNGLANVILSLVVIGIVTLIPIHDVINNPQYWYEPILQTSAASIIWSSYFILNTSRWMNIDRIKKLRHFASVLLNIILTIVFSYAFAYVIWTYGLKFQWPIPHCGILFFTITLIT